MYNCVLERLATELYVSPSHISHVIHQETGKPLSKHITARRIQEGCKLLRTTANPIHEIGRRIGYGSAAYFCRVFKKMMGVTPEQFRQGVQVNSD